MKLKHTKFVGNFIFLKSLKKSFMMKSKTVVILARWRSTNKRSPGGKREKRRE